ncbi:NACHT domain-containing protein, partial [Streptomyces scopuliridis]
MNNKVRGRVAELGLAGRDGANRDLKNRLKAAMARQGLSQADIVRQTQLNGESVSKAAVSNALNPEKGPPVAFTLGAILNAAVISGTERDELFRLRDRAESHGTTQLEAYLEAAEKAARQHPYPGSLGAPSLPALADVYVRQQARTPAADDQDSPGPGDAAARGNQTGPAEPATEVFRADHDVRVLLGGPGGGKSTLLRAHLADSADGWLHGRTGRTIPVMVSAAALTGRDSLPADLDKAVTGNLWQVGLLDELGADFFRQPPRRGLSWLVLVDGLDEIPDTDARRTVLTKLAGAAGKGPYRFVVATRPLPATELDTLGRNVPRYELQPFSHDDLRTYATHWFRPLDDPGRHANAFIDGLEHSRLEVLARTPLMALMLCQLYAADPARPLPNGRTGAYQSFVELIYEQNTHKNIKNTHDEAIRGLKDRHQIPRDNQAAEQAAEQVRDHLPELIDHLAYERINGSTAPAVEIMASHLQASRPQKVRQDLWNAFLGDLLRPTGILTQRADDFDFLHQTLLEYHAARHAARDEQARAQLLHDLITSPSAPVDGRLKPPALDASYLGFLLDGLLAPQDRITAKITQYVEELTAHGDKRVCNFLTTQVDLRTNLPPRPTAAQLVHFARDLTLENYARLRAVQALAWLDDEAGAVQLASLLGDATLHGSFRVEAAEALADVDGEAGAAQLARFASDTTLEEDSRLGAVQALAWLDDGNGAVQLASLFGDTALHVSLRVKAAEALADVDGEAGAAQLARFATDTTLEDNSRLRAIQALAWVDGKAAAVQLASLASDTTLPVSLRVEAARALAEVDGEFREVNTLVRLANDTTLHGGLRVEAARALAWLDDEDSAAQLARFASDTTLDDLSRVQAAEALVRLANDPSLPDSSHLWAAAALAWVDGKAGATQLARLAKDTTLHGDFRVEAARALAWVDGKAGATQLVHLANDTTLTDSLRPWAVEALVRLVNDTTLPDRSRVEAARALAEVDDENALVRLANDTTLHGGLRVEAARALAEVDDENGAAHLAGLASDATLPGSVRMSAVEALVRLANDPSLPDSSRLWAAAAL